MKETLFLIGWLLFGVLIGYTALVVTLILRAGNNPSGTGIEMKKIVIKFEDKKVIVTDDGTPYAIYEFPKLPLSEVYYWLLGYITSGLSRTKEMEDEIVVLIKKIVLGH